MGSTRMHRPRITVGLILLSTLLLGTASTAIATAATTTTTPVMSQVAIPWGTSATTTLPNVPAGSTAVRLVLSAEWAWKPTRLSVCAGSTATSACKSTVTLPVPARTLATTTVTVPLPTSAGNKITVFNADASARVSLAVQSYTVPSTTTGPAGPATTGVPDGTKLTVHEGDLVVTKPGTVVDSMDVRGLVRIQASGVVIKRTLIRGRPLTSNMGLITNDLGAYPFTVEDSSLIAASPSPWVSGIIGNNFDVRRTEIAGVIDSVHITGSNVTVTDSWLHGNLYYTSDPNQGGGPSHADSIQIQAGNNLVFARNRIEGGRSSAIQTTQDRGPIGNVTVKNNQISGGACSINVAFGKYGAISGFAVRDNSFGLDTRNARCAIIAPSPTAVTNVSNEFTDGSNVTISRGW